MPRLLPALVLLGCTAAPVPSAPVPPTSLGAVTSELPPPDPRGILLEVSEADAGKRMFFRVLGLEPGETVGLATGSSYGGGPCVPSLGGMCLEIVGATRFMNLRANPSGVASGSLIVPEALAGRTACFQAAAMRGADGADSVGSMPVCIDIGGSDLVCDDLDRDCTGLCYGDAFLDDCGQCVGGTTGLEPARDDIDGDGIMDACDVCGPDAGAKFVIQWTEVAHYSREGGPYTFQVVLHENGDFAYYYTQVEPYELTPTIGWQGPAGDPFVELAHLSEYPVDYPNVYFDSTAGDLPVVEYSHPLELDDIRWTGEPLGLSDDGSIEVELGFDFDFLDASYSTATIISNGVITFGDGDLPGYDNGHLPSDGYGAFLAPMWDDLNPEVSGQIYTQFVPAGCERDCAGMWGGVAVVDDCGTCAGGSTALEADLAMDCAGVCDGEAFLDICDTCVGGTTGLEPADECLMGVDLIVDEDTLRGDLYVDYVDVGDDSCLVLEGCVRDTGVRRVLRFDTLIANIGDEDLHLGSPSESEDFVWDECHGHYHFTEYARYDMRDLATGEILPIGAKAGFCVMDLGIYDEDISEGSCEWYNCIDQGISAGCYDIYHSSLQCQWIDITDLEDGDYEVIVSTNPLGLIAEVDIDNNSASVPVNITGDEVTLLD